MNDNSGFVDTNFITGNWMKIKFNKPQISVVL